MELAIIGRFKAAPILTRFIAAQASSLERGVDQPISSLIQAKDMQKNNANQNLVKSTVVTCRQRQCCTVLVESNWWCNADQTSGRTFFEYWNMDKQNDGSE